MSLRINDIFCINDTLQVISDYVNSLKEQNVNFGRVFIRNQYVLDLEKIKSEMVIDGCYDFNVKYSESYVIVTFSV